MGDPSHGLRGHGEQNPLSSVNLKLLIAVLALGAGWKNLRNAAYCHWHRQSRSGDKRHLTQWRVASERKAVFPGVKQKSLPSQVKLFLTENTKPPVFLKIYTFPGKNGAGGGWIEKATQETVSTETPAGERNGYWGPFLKAWEERTAAL